MKALIILHSTTGNTRVVARYGARRLEGMGIKTEIHDILKEEKPSLDGVDLLGVAFPVMYFRPTLALERLIDELEIPPGLPAFVLATAAGEPGGALHVAVEQLEGKGCVVLGAEWVLAPSNWPTHLAYVRLLQEAPALGHLVGLGHTLLRPLWRHSHLIRVLSSLLWVDASDPIEKDRELVDRFLDGVAGNLMASRAGAQLWPAQLPYTPLLPLARNTDVDEMGRKMKLASHRETCTRCGSCVRSCPSRCITLDEGGVRFHEGCTACWACYNACPAGAISALATPRGKGRYMGPSAHMRKLFQG